MQPRQVVRKDAATNRCMLGTGPVLCAGSTLVTPIGRPTAVRHETCSELAAHPLCDASSTPHHSAPEQARSSVLSAAPPYQKHPLSRLTSTHSSLSPISAAARTGPRGVSFGSHSCCCVPVACGMWFVARLLLHLDEHPSMYPCCYSVHLLSCHEFKSRPPSQRNDSKVSLPPPP